MSANYARYEMLPDMADWKIECLVGDRGYDSNKIRKGPEKQ